jgi:hypothetical protein
MRYITLPTWALPDDAKKDKQPTKEGVEDKPVDIEQSRINLGIQLAKANLAASGDFSGKLVIDILPDPHIYLALTEHIGSELVVTLKNNENSYGRLASVHYAIVPTNYELKLILKITLDCVVSEKEYNKLKMSYKDLGFIYNHADK